MNILLDTDVVVELCMPEGGTLSELMRRIFSSGDKIWIFAGAIHQLLSRVTQTILELKPEKGLAGATKEAREILHALTSKFNWLSALSLDDVDIFLDEDPAGAQLFKAFQCLGDDSRLISKNPDFVSLHEDIVTPEDYLAMPEDRQRIDFIDLNAQQDRLRGKIEKNIHSVLHHGKYILGPEVQKLENQLTEFTGAKHCIGVSSGTDALLMALMAYDVGPGDAIFTTPFTFIATAEVISLLGATPIFVDIDPRTYNLDPAQLELAIEAVKNNSSSIYPIPRGNSPLKPKGIIPVDLYGLPADYDSIMACAERHALFVLEDAAQGLGGVYHGRIAGALGHVSATSFFPAKPLGCYGDGGAVLTDDSTLAEKLKSIRVHGKGTHKYDNIRIGLNARLHTMQAAILLPKLEAFPAELEARQRVAEQYSTLLEPLKTELTTPYIPEGLRSAWAQYSIVSKHRERIQQALKTAGIPSMVYYPKPLHQQTAYEGLGYSEGNFPHSEHAAKNIFSLPMYPYLEEKTIQYITQNILDAF